MIVLWSPEAIADIASLRAYIAEDNPDLPMSMIQGILEAQAELKAGLAQPYQWGVIPNG